MHCTTNTAVGMEFRWDRGQSYSITTLYTAQSLRIYTQAQCAVNNHKLQVFFVKIAAGMQTGNPQSVPTPAMTSN